MDSNPCILVFPFSVMSQTLSQIEVRVKAPWNGWTLKVKSMQLNGLANKWIAKSCVLSWPLPSLGSAHGWLSTALCIVISNSSSAELQLSNFNFHQGFSTVREEGSYWMRMWKKWRASLWKRSKHLIYCRTSKEVRSASLKWNSPL